MPATIILLATMIVDIAKTLAFNAVSLYIALVSCFKGNIILQSGMLSL
jgi:hypothetical protein